MLRHGMASVPPRMVDEEDDSTYVDFSSAGLYLVGLQTVTTTGVVASASVAIAMVHSELASAVRNLAVCVALTVACLWRPIRVGRVAGLSAVFNALRPAPSIFTLSLALAQLTHSCVANEPLGEAPFWRVVVFHALQVPLVCCGLWRACKPMSIKDAPVIMCGGTLLVLSLAPLPAARGEGPLCAAPSLALGALRIMRALLFATCFAFHVFCSAPCEFERGEVLRSSLRAAAASVWILGSHVYVLPVALVQMGLLLWNRLGMERDVAGVLDALEQEVRADAEAGAMEYTTVSVHSDGESELGVLPSQTLGFRPGDKKGVFVGMRLDEGVRAAALAEHAVTPCSGLEYTAEQSAPVSVSGMHVEPQTMSHMRCTSASGQPWKELRKSGLVAMTKERMAQIAETIS